jgi:hypothetical protein
MITEEQKQKAAENWWTNFKGHPLCNPQTDDIFKAWGWCHVQAFLGGVSWCLSVLKNPIRGGATTLVNNEMWEQIKYERELFKKENVKLKNEIEVLRSFGNKDCTGQADEYLENQVKND